MIFCLIGMKNNITYFSSDQFFGLHYFSCKIFPVNILSYQYKINNRTILSPGKIAGEINANKIAQAMNNFIYHTVNTGFLHYDTMNIAKERMIGICLVDLFVAITQGVQKPCILKPVQLYTDRIGGLPEFRFQ